MRSLSAIILLGLLVASFHAAGTPAPVVAQSRASSDIRKLPVPKTHPRIGFTSEDIKGIRERIQAEPWASQWNAVESRASGARRMDPKNALSNYGSLQVRCFMLTQALECAGFHALISDDADAAAELSELLAEFDDEPFHKLLPENEFMPRGEFLEGFATCYDWAYNVLTPEARANMERILKRHAGINYQGFVQKKSWEATTEANNHSMAAMGAVGLSGLALWHEHDAAKDWAGLAARKAKVYFETSFDEKGAAYEGNMYGFFGLARILPFQSSIVRYGYEDCLGEGRLTGMVDQLIHEVVPGGSMCLPLNDSAGSYLRSPAVSILYAATHYGHARARWMWDELYKRNAGGQGHSAPWAVLWESEEVKPEPPEGNVRVSGDRGLVVARTGWGEDDFMVSFEAGKRLNGLHCQGDHGHFLIWSHGGWLASDTGYCNNAKVGWPNQTDGHNVLLVDGKSQAIVGGGKFATAEMKSVEEFDTALVMTADLREAYGKGGYNPLKKALRTMLVMFPPEGAVGYDPYIVLLDEFEKGGKDTAFTWMLHGEKSSQFEFGENAFVHNVEDRALDVSFHLEDKRAELTFGTTQFPSNNFGEHPRLDANYSGEAWRGLVVLAPRGKDDVPVQVESEHRGGKLTVTVTRGNVVDEFEWRIGKKLEIKREIDDDEVDDFDLKLK